MYAITVSNVSLPLTLICSSALKLVLWSLFATGCLKISYIPFILVSWELFRVYLFVFIGVHPWFGFLVGYDYRWRLNDLRFDYFSHFLSAAFYFVLLNYILIWDWWLESEFSLLYIQLHVHTWFLLIIRLTLVGVHILVRKLIYFALQLLFVLLTIIACRALDSHYQVIC